MMVQHNEQRTRIRRQRPTFWQANRSLPLGFLILALVALTTLPACPGTPPPPSTDAGSDADVVVDRFDDHAVGNLSSETEYFDLAAEGAGRMVVKFSIVHFQDDWLRAIRFVDSNFYHLHDEWYWYQLLNGARVPSVNIEPVEDLSFETIAQIYQWAEGRDRTDLPLDLRWVRGNERLYSPNFYNEAFRADHPLGLGSLMYVEAVETETESRPERWVFELEYSDNVTHTELVIFFDTLIDHLPDDVGDALVWAIRSPAQETLAQTMEADQLRYYDRVIRYSELAVPGEVEVYSEGLTAGRVFVSRTADGADLSGARDTSLVLTDFVPDFLPPASGLITAVPQTELAHINVLARNRGIPNLYVGGILDDPSTDQLARVQAPAVLFAEAPDQYQLQAITYDQFRTWRDLGEMEEITLPSVDPSELVLSYSLDSLDASDDEALRLIIGGKAAGFLGLMAPGDVVIPDSPMVITVKAYMAHLAPIVPSIQALLDDDEFQDSNRMQYLCLEGLEDYDALYSSDSDQAYRDQLFRQYPESSVIGDVLRADGIKRIIRDRAIDSETLAELTSALENQFGHYSPMQGLRFRSSSSVEDVDGFNGAGLYDSNTGYFNPSLQSEDHRNRTIEWAIKKTWSSYWSFEAFQERDLEQIRHLSGHMAVLVHARFDDEMEMSNGVFTLTLMPEGSDESAIMDLNVQLGAESVTNPEPGSLILPEVDRVAMADGGEVAIDRVRGSDRMPEGDYILSDDKLQTIFEQALSVALAWRARTNSALEDAQQSEVLTLDFEFREMREGWPALAEDPQFESRIVIKQARTLDPGLRPFNHEVRAYPIPRDVLARAARVEHHTCVTDSFDVTVIQVLTDPLRTPDMGFASDRFTASMEFEATADIDDFDLDVGDIVAAEHLDFAAYSPNGETWTLDLEMASEDESPAAFERLVLDGLGGYRLEGSEALVTGAVDHCTTTLLHSTQSDYLRSLLED